MKLDSAYGKLCGKLCDFPRMPIIDWIGYRNCYPKGREWKFDMYRAFFHEWSGLFNPKSWRRDPDGCRKYGSWSTWLADMKEWILCNIPWFKNRKLLLGNFIDRNSSKLLDWNHKSASIRTYGDNIIYYTILFNGFNMTLTKESTIDKRTDKTTNRFVNALFSVDGTADDDNYEDKQEILLKGKCVTLKDAQKLFDKMVELTPELDWFDDD